MKTILSAIQNLLQTIPDLKYVDENWGQLSDYSPNPPTQFPLALIDVGNVSYTDIGIDRSAVPQNRQMATATVVITIANLKLTNTSGRAPQTQKMAAWSIWDVVELVHAKLHGQSVNANVGGLIRLGLKKIKRDDGIQEFEVTYTVGITNC